MRRYRNLEIEKLLDLANARMGDPMLGNQIRKRAEEVKLILELVALLVSIPQSQHDEEG